MASPGSFQPNLAGPGDVFLAKFNLAGSRVWATYYGGLDYEYQGRCEVDDSANVFLCGGSRSFTNIATANSYQPVNHTLATSGANAFIVKFNSSGQRQWGTYYGDTVFTYFEGIAISADTIFVSGRAMDTRRVATAGAFQTYMAGYYDGIIVKFEDCLFPDTTTLIAGPDSLCAPIIVVYDCAPISNTTGYTWTAPPGATIVNGQNTPSVTIDFGTNAASGLLSVSGVNACGNGEPKSFFVHVGSVITPTISGTDTACVGAVQTYITETGKVHYYWTVTGGTVSGGGSASDDFVTVLWATPGLQSVAISYTDSIRCNSNTYQLDVLVQADLPVSVSITATPNPVCAGDPVIIMATPAHGGTTPSYLWKVNGVNAGTNSSSYTYTPSDGDLVTCTLTSSESCASGNPATSSPLLITVDPNYAVNVTISPDINSVCAGTLVTFTAVPDNPGPTPVYLWKVNGVNAGTNSSTYSYFPQNNDGVTCVMTSSYAACTTNNPATSNAVIMQVNANLPITLTLTSISATVCQGSTVTFTAHPGNEGLAPIYTWYKNSNPVGTNSDTYTFTPVNGDLVSCTLTSSEICTSNNPVSSIQYPVSVSPIDAVSVTVSPSQNPFCQGSSVTFTAFPVAGGTTPHYQWIVNGLNVGTDQNTYTYFPANGDLVSCILNSSEPCTINNPASSIAIQMVENNNLPAGVSISASSNPFCPGSSVTFTATPGNGGSLPVYNWKVNGITVGINSNTYTYNPANGDSVRCIMSSNLACVTGNPASSNKIIMSGTLAPVVTFTSCIDTITTINAKPIKLKGGIPLGGTYSGPGVNSLTGSYTPSLAGTGTRTITYSYTNAALCTAAKSISILNLPSSILTCGNPLTDVRDNKIYQTVQIGAQCWLATNLNFGTTIASPQDQRDNCISEKYCYNDNPMNCTNHGGLYQWDEVMRFDETPADQGYCPPGWHIPSENEWNTLFAVYISSGFAGSPLKYSGYSGFNALLSGARHINKGWDFQGFATFFWSSTARSDNKAWAHGMNDADPSVSLYPSSRANAFSVRCLKD
jgi:uncharacterized protein (TIGR02145 family)